LIAGERRRRRKKAIGMAVSGANVKRSFVNSLKTCWCGWAFSEKANL
jgi:hypothetical protein